MARKKQALTKEECEEILINEPRGVLAVLGDNGYPYALPINHYYENGVLYFHSGNSGHKIDAIKACSKASFCVYDKGCRKPGDWALNIKSVIVFGKIEIIENKTEALDICVKLSRKFTNDEEYISKEVERSGAGVLCFKLIPEHMTGKLVNES